MITIAQLKDLIVSGTARIIGKLYSSEFVGKLTGNADTATKATQDSVGQQINTTYIKGLSVSGKTVTYTKGDGTTGTITTQDTNTTYSNATTSAAGLMSASDKSKLDGITDSADAVSFSQSLTGGTKVGTITINGTGTDLYCQTNTDTHYTSHLYVGASGGNANATSATSNPYLLCVDNTTNRNSIQLKAGSNMSISAVDGVVTFTATDTTYSTATTSANGLMSSSDKSKLDGIADGANNYTHPTTAGNKHIPSGGSGGQILGYSASGTAAWTNSVSNLVVLGSLSVNRKADTNIGTRSVAIGQDASATEMGAIAIGRDSSATGLDAIAIGRDTTATGGFCIGTHSETNGSYSFAAGNYTIANQSQFSIGHYNSASSSSNSYGTIGTAFVIGNGTRSSSSNACRITYEGAVIGKAAYQSTGADFAELREWSDGNPNNEDRRGYFVTMDGMNIRIASPGDYICGIISANPSVIGNNDEDWMGRYVFDDFGAFIYEDYEETDPETGEIRTFTRYKENPEYDPTREYEFRADRPEWDYVGLCGVIHVRDDGTCQQNGFCKCSAGGIATASERGYRVLERVNDHIVKVLFYLTGETF